MTEPTEEEIIALLGDRQFSSITAVREALRRWGQPAVAGEPVAWLSTDSIGERYLCFTKPKDSNPARPLVFGDTTPPSQAAESVRGDADPLQGAANWLAEAHGQFCVAVLQGCLMIGYNRAKRLHDAAIAARKQGGAT